ncbi:MAG: hypothetical protein VYA03_02530 [Bacteroidota bacterium]|nr:hypothetical protein [Bacteroidota bacterium]
MKLILFFTLFLMISCNEEKVDRNPFLQEISFDERINLSLPTFDNLRYQGGSVYWQNGGIKGLNLFNLSGTIMAWEASCPNHVPNQCSRTLINGISSKCQCDNLEYSLATGQPLTDEAKYGLLLYRVQQSGNNVRIYN